MNIHYFQRYTEKENVVTNNTMLLLQRFYYYSPDKFDKILTKLMENIDNEFNINIQWSTQLKCEKSVPDAQIRQNSFNILVETKLGRFFDINQIQRHLSSFTGKDKYEIMLTLSPKGILQEQKMQIENLMKENNKVKHIHLTFEELIQLIDDELDRNRDYEFYEILDDFEKYCSESGLLNNNENVLRVVPTGVTYYDNIKYNMYYDNKDNGYMEHAYLGLYKDKAVRQIGRIKYNVVIEIEDNKIIKGAENLTEEIKKNILEMAKLAKTHGYSIDKNHRFFIVDKFYETNFEKITKSGIMGKRRFFIDSIIGKKVKSAEELAENLKDKKWS